MDLAARENVAATKRILEGQSRPSLDPYLYTRGGRRPTVEGQLQYHTDLTQRKEGWLLGQHI
jgi:hypothetical protein